MENGSENLDLIKRENFAGKNSDFESDNCFYEDENMSIRNEMDIKNKNENQHNDEGIGYDETDRKSVV